MKPLFLMVTRDKYELPLAVADTPTELSQLTHASLSTICRSLNDQRRGKRKKSIYRCVWVDA